MNLLEKILFGKKNIQRNVELDEELSKQERSFNNNIQVMESSARVIQNMTRAMIMMESQNGKDRK